MNDIHQSQITNHQKGQSLFEVVVAIAISAIIIVALVSLTTNSIRNATYSRNNTLASRHVQDVVEWLRGQRDNNSPVFAEKILTPVWCFDEIGWIQSGVCQSGDVIPGTTFTRQVEFTPPGAGSSVTTANIRVSWEDSQGFHEVVSTTNFSDWRQR